jgi:pyruvate dehydrogenase E1 component beta subunit
VLRVGGFDIPYPPPKLEHAYLPGVDRILDAVDRLQFDDQPDVRHLAGNAA